MKIAVLAAILAIPAASHAAVLEGATPILLAGPTGAFDFMATDGPSDRILAAHRGAGTLEILDLATGRALPAVAVGAAQGVAVDSSHHRYFTGNEKQKSVVAVDSASRKKVGEVALPGPVDAIAYDPKRDRIYAAEDDGKRVWVIDAKGLTLIGEVGIPGSPEMMEYDALTDSVYLNVKDKNAVVRIDPEAKKVTATWPTLPATAPHGLVVDSDLKRLFVAGANGKIVALDLRTGKPLASASISPRVDQLAYDASTRTLYGAGHGKISVTKVTSEGLTMLPEVPAPPGAHTLAIDKSRHDVWISFTDGQKSFLQKFSPRRE